MKKQLWAALLGSLVLMLVLVASAFADNWGAGAWGGPGIACDLGTVESECTPDDEWHYVYIDSAIVADWDYAFANSIEDDYNSNPGIQAFVDTTLDDVTDVRIKIVNIDNDLDFIMYATCSPDATTGSTGPYKWCKRQQIRFDNTQPGYNSCTNDWRCRDFYACHELGHTMGLQHPGNFPNENSSRVTCMDYHDDINPDAHDRDHLDDCFPRPAGAPATLTPLCRL